MPAAFRCEETNPNFLHGIGYHPNAPLRVLDLCTGTGCIPILLHALLAPLFPCLQFAGIDISSTALNLARDNVRHNISRKRLRNRASREIQFYKSDVLAEDVDITIWTNKMNWDVVVSNPPYISPRGFDTTTSRSVRKYEPKEALVPPFSSSTRGESAVSGNECGDAFYPHILRLAKEVRAKFLLVEVADIEQAGRVAGMVLRELDWQGCQIWRDYPAQDQNPDEKEYETIFGRPVVVKGAGNRRAVFAWRGTADWASSEGSK